MLHTIIHFHESNLWSFVKNLQNISHHRKTEEQKLHLFETKQRMKLKYKVLILFKFFNNELQEDLTIDKCVY